jgi:hypothetical protein
VKATFTDSTGRQEPQIVLEPGTDEERLLLKWFHAAGAGKVLTLHGYTVESGRPGLGAVNFGWTEKKSRGGPSRRTP